MFSLKRTKTEAGIESSNHIKQEMSEWPRGGLRGTVGSLWLCLTCDVLPLNVQVAARWSGGKGATTRRWRSCCLGGLYVGR